MMSKSDTKKNNAQTQQQPGKPGTEHKHLNVFTGKGEGEK